MDDIRLAEVQEEIDARNVQKMRARHAQLKSRLLDAGTRLYGVDTNALDEQVSAKKRAAMSERKLDVDYASFLSKVDVQLTELDIQKKGQYAEYMSALRQQWDAQCEQKKADMQGTNGIPDMTNPGVSSAQRFDGEDHGNAIRKKLQAAQLRRFCREQMEEKAILREAERAEDAEMAKFLKNVADARETVEQQQEKRRREKNREMMQSNQRLAAERGERELQKRAAEAIADKLELDSLSSSALHNYDPATGRNVNQPHRVRPDHYKGFSRERLHELRQAQHDQVLEKLERMRVEKELEASHAEHTERLVLLARDNDLRVIEEQQRQRQKLREQLEAQRAEYKSRRDAEALARRNNSIGQGFFQQFGKSHR